MSLNLGGESLKVNMHRVLNISPSERASAIPPFLAMDILDQSRRLEAQGKEIVHLELGEPDFPTPENVIEAAERAIRDGYTSYTPTQGILELRRAISEHYREEYRVSIDPDRIIATMGSSPGMLLVFGTLLNPGDEIIIPNPHYPPYPHNIRFIGGVPVKMELEEADGFKYHPQAVRERLSPRTKGIMVNSPSNPTGMLQGEDVLRGLAGISEETGVFIISDEIYHGVTYGEKAHSILEYTDRAFVLSGFSKRYAMTGWRLGWVIAPEEFIPPMKNLHMNYFLSAAGFVQVAGIEALTNCAEAAERMRVIYQERRDYLIPELRRLGFGIEVEPQGAFYLLINARKFSDDSVSLASDILANAGVAITPGLDFGERAEGYLRISYATAMEGLKEGVRRLGGWGEGRGERLL